MGRHDSSLVDEAILRLFCRRVAATYRVNLRCGYPANLFELRQFLNWHSETYYFRVAEKLVDSIRDPGLHSSNLDNLYRWKRLLGTRVVGGDSHEIIQRMIEVLELERVVIEVAFDQHAFRFGDSVRPLPQSV